MLKRSLLSIRIKVLIYFVLFTCLSLYDGTTRSKKIFLITARKACYQFLFPDVGSLFSIASVTTNSFIFDPQDDK